MDGNCFAVGLFARITIDKGRLHFYGSDIQRINRGHVYIVNGKKKEDVTKEFRQIADLVLTIAVDALKWQQKEDGYTISRLKNEIKNLEIALADAIRCPMGVVPDSATGLLSTEYMDAAEKRRKKLA